MSGFYHIRSDTLAGVKSSALFMTRSMATQPLPLAMEWCNKYITQVGGHASPEGEAFKFYFANHTFSVISQKYDSHEPLPDETLELARGYVKLGSDLIVRLAYYILLITTREMRHMHGLATQKIKALDMIEEKYGKDVSKFISALGTGGEDTAEGKLRKNPPDVPLAHYLGGLSIGFHKGGWSSAYGGPKWGVVTDTLHNMVLGKTSPELFADIGFTLAHNGGPIFNKGFLYSHWGHLLYKILDVQRSGQVPQLYEEGGVKEGILDPATKQYVQMARKVFPVELTGPVDWYKVEALGALHKYPAEKAKMGGNSEFASAAEKVDTKKFFVGPSEFVKMVEREEVEEELVDIEKALAAA